MVEDRQWFTQCFSCLASMATYPSCWGQPVVRALLSGGQCLGCLYWIVAETRVPSRAEGSSAHVLFSFCLEICAVKAAEDTQGLWVVRYERVNLKMLHCLNGGLGLGGFGVGFFFCLKLKSLQR